MAATFDDFINIVGVNKNTRYSIGQIAGMLSKSRRTIESYCDGGVRTDRGGIVTLPVWKDGPKGYCIIGDDLIEFLRQINGA